MLSDIKNSKKLAHSAGFSLIELMVVLAIVSILAAISYPSYLRYVQRARRPDAAAAMALIQARQEIFFSTNNNNTYTTNLANLGFPGGQTDDGLYTLSVTTCAGGAIATCYLISAVAVATGSQATDRQGTVPCSTLTLSSRNVKTPIACWAR